MKKEKINIPYYCAGYDIYHLVELLPEAEIKRMRDILNNFKILQEVEEIITKNKSGGKIFGLTNGIGLCRLNNDSFYSFESGNNDEKKLKNRVESVTYCIVNETKKAIFELLNTIGIGLEQVIVNYNEEDPYLTSVVTELSNILFLKYDTNTESGKKTFPQEKYKQSIKEKRKNQYQGKSKTMKEILNSFLTLEDLDTISGEEKIGSQIRELFEKYKNIFQNSGLMSGEGWKETAQEYIKLKKNIDTLLKKYNISHKNVFVDTEIFEGNTLEWCFNFIDNILKVYNSFE
ncbi:hypothetical protein HGA92_03340 [Candidatus Gracilibacteria bacterium]|nr:hypothetical protein [Candidatus Gracilibacteria bacterium]NUJ99132.1 hypothetical protein [Candidatus Gracilibacteria bacterium]